MPLSSKRFIISTDALNSYKFRVLTSGAILEGFKKNPVMLWMHIRPAGNLKGQILPLGNWPAEYLEVSDDGVISGIPFFDDKDDFAMSIYNKVEAGLIRMCSAGLKAIEVDENEDNWVSGQELPTVLKWELHEVSIVDIGANPEALVVALYDNNDKLITLSANPFRHLTKKNTMNKKTKTALDAYKKVQLANADKLRKLADADKAAEEALADDTTTDEDKQALADAQDENKEMTDEDKDAKIAELTQKLAEMGEQLKTLQDEKALAEADEAETKAENLAKLAFAQGKISHAEIEGIKELALDNYPKTKKYIDGKKVHLPAHRQLADKTITKTADQSKLETLSAKSWDELFKGEGDLDYLKLNAPDVYNEKYTQKFKKAPKGK